MMKMKKNIIALGLIVAATFALTNCTKEIDNPADGQESAGIPFEITASASETKTINDGFGTQWVTDDALNVFHAEKGATVYVNDGKFTYTSGNAFTGTIASELTAAEYDWYAFYPYNYYNTTPAGNSSDNFSYQTIAQSSGGVQTQKGNDSMAHLSGKNFPMYGKVIAANDDAISVSMNHLVSVIELTVTNNTDKPIKISEVAFTAEQNVVGTYYIDFSGSEVKYTQVNNVNSTATLNVVEAENIAKSSSAKFYIAVKPFTANAGDKLTMSVNGYAKVVTLDKDVTFAAGRIKKLSFNYDAPNVIYSTAFDYPVVGSSYQSASEITGTDAGTTISWGIVYGNWNDSSTAQMRVYKEGNFGSVYMKFDVSKATIVSYRAKVSNAALTLNTYYSTDSGETWVKVDNNKALTTNLESYSFVISETGEYEKVRVKFEASGTAPDSGNYQLTIDDVVISGEGEVLVEKDPTIVVKNSTVALASSATSAEFEYSLIDIDGTPSLSVTSDPDGIINGLPTIADGIVSVNLNANTEAKEKTATLTLSFTGADDVILTITQAAYVDLSGQIAYSKVEEIESGEKYLLVAEFDGGSYIFNGADVKATTPAVDASTLSSGDKIISNDLTDSYAVTITASGEGYVILLSTGKYLVINENAAKNGSLKSADQGEIVSVTESEGKYLFASTVRATRGLVYRNDAGGFKNYAVVNATATGYCGYLTLYKLSK